MDQTDLTRASIGQMVAKRLSEHPGSFKVPAVNLDVFVIRDFLTTEECGGLMARIDYNREPSTVLGERQDPDYRTSESCNLNPHDPLVKMVEAKITGLMGIEPSHGETIQGQRYAEGQQFKPHHDYFFTTEAYWEEQKNCGGQRTWTAMMFLNKPDAGGQTFFPKAGVRITPRAGNLLAWNNMDVAGEPNEYSLHQGCPVEAGVKYIITKWYRERPWGHQAPPAY